MIPTYFTATALTVEQLKTYGLAELRAELALMQEQVVNLQGASSYLPYVRRLKQAIRESEGQHGD